MKDKKRFFIDLLVVVFLVFVFLLLQKQSYLNQLPKPYLAGSKILPKVDKATSFAVAVLPDTQFYTQKYPSLLCQQTDWLVANRERLNIVFVSQLGDIVNDGGKLPKEWQVASTCLGQLDGKIPYSVVPGNHDAETAGSPVSGYEIYNTTFSPERFKKYAWYQGNYQGNQNNYEVISQGKQILLFFNLEYDPTDEAMTWAQTVLNKYPKAYTILTTHRYLLDDGRGRDSVGQRIWQKLVYRNCSIKLVWSGHYHGENRLTSLNGCGDKVEQITQDYQTLDNGGNGYLRLYVFTPSRQKIDVYTYSPIVGALETDDNSQFTISW